LKSMVRGQSEKRLNAVRIGEIKQATGKPLTLHGGSGTNNQDFLDAIRAGITVIHINTELRIAWRRGMEDSLAKNPNDVEPYHLLPEVVESVKRVVLSRLELFNSSRAALNVR
jgi:fructose-bisphosphate aldolase, class II